MKASVCRALVTDILEPATLDLDGTIALFFTPSAAASGYAYDCDHVGDAWQRFHWTLMENPHLPKAAEWLEQRKHENSWSDNSPVYRREYLGEWIRDEDSLVYAYDGKLNCVDPFPDSAFESHILGIDLGFIDSTAFVVIGFSEDHAEACVVYADKMSGLTTDDIAKRIHKLNDRFDPVRTVADSGGLGRMVIEECNRRHELNIWPAEKSKKLDHIELINSDFRSGRFLIEDTVATEPLRDELVLLEWDPNERERGRYIEADHLENHCSDAMLYAWRECLHYLHRASDKRPEKGSGEYFQKVEKEMEEELVTAADGPEPEWWTVQDVDSVYPV
jgi:hypothetical protein